MMSIFNEKIVILVGMFIATMVFGLIPVWMVKYLFKDAPDDEEEETDDHHHETRRGHGRSHHHQRRRLPSHETGSGIRKAKLKKVISYASCFSGGVFIAACLLDLLPDVHEAFDHVLDEIENQYHTKVDYPVAEFIIVVGFFIVLILEQIVMDCKEQWHKEDFLNRPGNQADERRPLLSSPRSQYGSNNDHPSINESTNDETDTGSLNGISFGGPSHHSQHHDGHSHSSEIFGHSAFRSVLLIIALTFHSLFEGLAIGLQKELGQLMSIFVAVVVHKAVMAFSLGLNIVQSNFSALVSIASIFIFSVSSPIGMGIGMVLADMEQSLISDTANGILQGIAGGTFLYITFFEVLPHELNAPHNRMPKLLFVLFGFSCICGLLFLTH